MRSPIIFDARRALSRFTMRAQRDQSSCAPDQSGSVSSDAKASWSKRFVVSQVKEEEKPRQTANATSVAPGINRHAMKRRRQSLMTIAYSSLIISFASQSAIGLVSALDRLLIVLSMIAIVASALSLGMVFGCAMSEQEG